MKQLFLILALACSSLNAAQTRHPLGWRSSPTHSKGLTQIRNHPAFRAAPLPASFSLEAGLPKVYDQYWLGSCVANAGAAAFDYQWNQRTHFFIYSGPSRLDLYQNCLRHDGDYPVDSGTYVSTCLKVLKEKGVLQENTWPYVPHLLSAKAPSDYKQERRKYAAVKTFDVPNDDNGFSVKQAIANAHLPVIIGGYVFNDIFKVTKDNPFIPMPVGKPAGGHCILAIGYDDNLTHDGQTGFVRIRNSWSEQWGDAGEGWLPYAYVFNPKLFEDFGAIQTTGRRLPHTPPPAPQQPRQSFFKRVFAPHRK